MTDALAVLEIPGCATRPGRPGAPDPAIGPEHVQELVHEVLHEMKNRGLL